MKLPTLLVLLLAALQLPVAAGPLDGIWINSDKATRSIPRVEISGNQFVWWGKTHPEDSKYGPVSLTLLGDAVADATRDNHGYAIHDARFADKIFVMKRVDSELILDCLTIFKDGSGRANYLNTLTFQVQR